MIISLQYWRSCTGYQSGRELNSRFSYWRTSVCMELHLLTWGNCWKSMSHPGHWDQHPRTYSASRETIWKPTVTDRLVPVPQNYGISSQIIFGQLGVWQFLNDNWKHIYVQRCIYQLTMWISTSILWQWNVMRLWACLYGKGAISNDNIIIIWCPAQVFVFFFFL